MAASISKTCLRTETGITIYRDSCSRTEVAVALEGTILARMAALQLRLHRQRAVQYR
jgi:hypothetical protein